LPYLAELEKEGIPTVVIDFEDEVETIKQEAIENGIPMIRSVHASRTFPGPEDMDNIIKSVFDALTRPLNDQETETGTWAPEQPRVLFEGTLTEADTFYHQFREVPYPLNAPISVYTDGLPVIIPTEERVKEMLTGTSHRPDELIAYQTDRIGDIVGEKFVGERLKGLPVKFPPTNMTATVEKVAVNAVMAGCRPEHLPVILAMAESGCPTGTTTFHGQWVCLSGPIVKEIKMNVGYGMLDPGSPVNMPIGRAYQLLGINLGGAIPGVTRMNAIGNPFNTGGTCFAENAEGLPPGWKGLNEEYGFKKNESVIMCMNGLFGIQGRQFSPGGYRAFQKSGHGGIARRLDVKGKPGPHNWLEYIVPGLWANQEGGWTFLMVPEMARHLYEYGFKSKDEVYQWLWKKSFMPVKEYRNYSWVDLRTNGWMGIESTSGKPWKELPDDYMVPAAGDDPNHFLIIVGGSEEEVCLELGGRLSGTVVDPVFSIDAWR
jgi:hypothetical protein